MRTLFRRVVVSWSVALVVLTLLAAPAAASDHVFRIDYAGGDSGIDVCGIIVDISYSGTLRATIREWVIGPATEDGQNEFWIGTGNNHGSETHTNVATGESLVFTWRTNIHEASMVDVGDGFWEYTYSISGIAVKMNGTPLKDRGHLVFTDTIYFGDLSTWEDDYFVSESVVHVAGQWPGADDAAFCEAYVAAIG